MEEKRIKIRPMLKSEQDMVRQWFLLPTFYYDTESPDIAKKEKIDYIIDFSSSYVNIIEEKREENGQIKYEPIGLLDFFFSTVNGKVSMDFQLVDPADWERIGSRVLENIFDFIQRQCDYHKITKNIYGFDTGALRVFGDSTFVLEGIYPSFSYKNRKYWDVYVYSIFKDNK